MAPLIVGHRALPHEEPENSLAGVRRAPEFGLDGIESDVRLSLDRVPMVFHDWSLRRMTGLPGPVLLYPSFVLRRLRLRGSQERIPTLAQVLDALPSGCFLAIEIKDAPAAPATLRLVRERALEGRVLMWSYRERAIRYFAKHAPEIERTLLREDVDPEGLTRYLDDARAYGAQGISPHWSAVTAQLIAEAHDRGLRVYSLNRDFETVAKKARYGLDGIVTDSPAEVRALLAETAVG